jgi:hypothetical protein
VEIIQLALDFAAVSHVIESNEYSLSYLQAAYQTYSADTIAENQRIRGIFYHQGLAYVCTAMQTKWVVNCLTLTRIYTPLEWEKVSNSEAQSPSHYWGKEVSYRSQTHILGNSIELKPNPQEKERAIAREKVRRAQEKIECLKPYITGERQDPNWGRDHYQRQLEEAKLLWEEGREQCRKLGITTLVI